MNNQKICRLCLNNVYTPPLFSFHNLPEKVQNFTPIGKANEIKGIDLGIYQCPSCGFIQVLQKPVDYYRDVIRAVAVSPEMREFRIKYFSDFFNKYDLQHKKIIEIGAGCGEYIELAKTACPNADIQGIEHKEESCRKAKNNGLNVYEAFIEDESSNIPNAPYDAFFIMNFLEHIPNPRNFLMGIANNLTEDGYGLVEVPNGDMIIKNNMYSEFMLEHLSYFTKDTLRLMLETSGFKVFSCEVIWHDYIICSIVQKRKTIDVSAFNASMNESLDRIKNIVDGFSGKNVAVWGAGHQALTLLALANLGDKIKCVIDSAPFKQNKLTPVTSIPIYSPDCIEKLGITAVVILAGSYSEEVLKTINNKYPNVEAIIF